MRDVVCSAEHPVKQVLRKGQALHRGQVPQRGQIPQTGQAVGISEQISGQFPCQPRDTAGPVHRRLLPCPVQVLHPAVLIGQV